MLSHRGLVMYCELSDSLSISFPWPLPNFTFLSQVGGRIYPKDQSKEVCDVAIKHLMAGDDVKKVKDIVVPCPKYGFD